jgi:DNA-binding transcriptional LysR family regulator
MTVTDPTHRQLQVVRAYVELGGAKRAGHQLGLQPATVIRTMAQTRHRVGVDTTAQLVVHLTERGLIGSKEHDR